MDRKFIIACVVALLVTLYFVGTRGKKTDEDTSTEGTKRDEGYTTIAFDINNPISVPKDIVEELRNTRKTVLKPFKE